jgi:hypothetical protein
MHVNGKNASWMLPMMRTFRQRRFSQERRMRRSNTGLCPYISVDTEYYCVRSTTYTYSVLRTYSVLGCALVLFPRFRPLIGPIDQLCLPPSPLLPCPYRYRHVRGVLNRQGSGPFRGGAKRCPRTERHQTRPGTDFTKIPTPSDSRPRPRQRSHTVATRHCLSPPTLAIRRGHPH